MRPIDVTALSWRKSSHSNQDGGACVEVSDDVTAAVPVRDSKNPSGPVLVFPADGWSYFITAVKNDHLSA
ncbi:DUF397 domain-containing protein [Streptomyces sp. NPDC051018]|uniref:DUF397 domain-containing protein n=1 Tax=Streptomyces sp. NPDC051018 TaxID=3365639 RepID=UPI0037BC4C37